MKKVYISLFSLVTILSIVAFKGYYNTEQLNSASAVYYFETVKNNCSINIVIEYGQGDAGNAANVTKPVVKGDQITLPARTSRLFLYDAANTAYEIPNSSDCSPITNYIPGRYFVKTVRWNGNENTNIIGVEIYDVPASNDTTKFRLGK